MSTVAKGIVETLYATGVRRVFGLPGGEIVELLDAIRRAGMEFVLVHNESSAAFMADAYARAGGGVGVCLTTLGPGAANAVVGVAHAYLDRAPVLVFTAQKPDDLLPDYTHQVIDLQRLFAPITKATFKLGPHGARAAVQQALAIAQAGRPGPVHLQISNEDARLAAVEGEPPTAHHAGATPAGPPDQAAIARARELLAGARRPLIVAGLGLEPQRPYAALAELAEAAQAPVLVTPKAKGCLSDRHPLAAGAIGLTRADPAYAFLDEADCIVAVGFDVVELVKPWRTEAPLIWVAPWPNEDPRLPAAAELVGDMASALRQLCDAEFAPEPSWGEPRVAAFRGQQAQRGLPPPAPGRLLPQAVLAGLRAIFPDDALMAVDVGSHKIHASLEWPTYAANRFFLSNGLSSMGYGLPAAMGASLALPGTPVVCLTGDAGLAMVLGELAVLRRLHLPVIVVVLNDSALDLIRSHQVRAGKPVYATEFASPDFTAIARAYGLPSWCVTTETELDTAVRTAQDRGQPCLIEAMIDPIGYPTTPRPAA